MFGSTRENESAIRQEESVNDFKTALATAGFIGGPMVEGFECEVALYCDAAHCVGA
jgi:hypothetical protein